MTQHNITGSEAFRDRRHVVVRMGRRRPALSPRAAMIAIGAAGGVISGLADAAIGAPVFITLALVGLAVWRMWPER